jgi:hypothetical protein
MSKTPRQSLKVPASNDQQMTVEATGSSQAGMSASETARYISEFSAELSYLAREAKLDLLAYLLDMARLEAIRTLQMVEEDH